MDDQLPAQDGDQFQQTGSVPDDDFAPPDDGAANMKTGAKFMHGLHDMLVQCIEFMDAAKGEIDNPNAAKACKKVEPLLGRAFSQLRDVYVAYQAEHPDQPDLPDIDLPTDGPDMAGDEDEEIDEDEDAIPDGDEDAGDDDGEVVEKEDGDDEPDEEDEDKEKAKSFRRLARKEWRAFWRQKKLEAKVGDTPALEDAIEFCERVKGDKRLGFYRREAEKHLRALTKALGSQGRRPKPNGFEGIDLSEIQRKLTTA